MQLRSRAVIAEAAASDFGYAAYYWHARSVSNLTIHREYSSTFARWTSRDPVEEIGGLNLYSYVANNPTIFVDPTGLSIGGGGAECKPCAAKSDDPYAQCALRCVIECGDDLEYLLKRLQGCAEDKKGR